MSEHANPFLIGMPPGVTPARGDVDGAEGAETESATHRIDRPDAGRGERAARPVFFPGGPGTLPAGLAEDDAAAEDDAVPAAKDDEVPAAMPAPAWRLDLPDGGSHPLGSTTVLGRNPTVPDAWAGAATLAVADDTKTVSKTHAALEVDGDRLVVHDLGSTNGVVVDEQGVRIPVFGARAVPSGATIALGDYRIRIARPPRD